MGVIWYKIWFDIWHNKTRTFLAVLSIAAGVFAVALEPGEDWRMALWLPVQRFGYRQLMYFVV